MDSELDKILKSVSLETKWEVKTVECWIRLYAQRCDSIHHRRGFDALIQEGNLAEFGNRILEDGELLWEMTPPEIRTSIPHVFLAISDLEQTFFKKLTSLNHILSNNGDKIKKQANDRKAKAAAADAAYAYKEAKKAEAAAKTGNPSPEEEDEDGEDEEGMSR
jgi:hypothetical protein